LKLKHPKLVEIGRKHWGPLKRFKGDPAMMAIHEAAPDKVTAREAFRELSELMAEEARAGKVSASVARLAKRKDTRPKVKCCPSCQSEKIRESVTGVFRCVDCEVGWMMLSKR